MLPFAPAALLVAETAWLEELQNRNLRRHEEDESNENDDADHFRSMLLYAMLGDATAEPDPLIPQYLVWSYDDNR